MPKVNVSFKENVEELILYNEVQKHTDKSAFMKEALKFYLDCRTEISLKNIKK